MAATASTRRPSMWYCSSQYTAFEMRNDCTSALAEVEDAGRPVGVLVHERVFQLIAAGAIEFIKAVLVLREVGRDPVEQHADAGSRGTCPQSA